MLTRRNFLYGAGGVGATLAAQGLLPGWARAAQGLKARKDGEGRVLDLTIAETPVQIDGRQCHAMAVNGTLPGPLLRWREGEDVTIRVHNRLDEPTSIHWHGIILPYDMDGVPGVSFPGIPSRETFTYRIPVRQAGTYWYHSHSGMQEQLGHSGPLIIDPAGPDPVAYDREHAILLADWMFEDPHSVFRNLKKQSDYLNFRQRDAGELMRDLRKNGLGATLSDRLEWGSMRMSPADIADVTGHIYTYLMNGQGPGAGWTGLFTPGERVRLRIINGSAMTYFNVRIPGLSMTVVQADGQDVAPVDVEEFQIAVAETFDVIVKPRDDHAYTIMAESMDRTGFARGMLAPRPGMTAPVPPLRNPPRRTMVDMGMEMEGGMDGMSHGHHGHGGIVGPGPVIAHHGPDRHGPGAAGIAEIQRDRLSEPGTGLADAGHRVLVYSDLKALDARSVAAPERELELHLTGNMERYMWSFDGKKFSEVKGPIPFRHGERLRLILVNDTMMEHPIHLHGMWMELENGQGDRIPRKHTISVKPAERISLLVDADAPGRWAFHCHLLFHMDAGMFRVVEVTPYDGETA